MNPTGDVQGTTKCKSDRASFFFFISYSTIMPIQFENNYYNLIRIYTPYGTAVVKLTLE